MRQGDAASPNKCENKVCNATAVARRFGVVTYWKKINIFDVNKIYSNFRVYIGKKIIQKEKNYKMVCFLYIKFFNYKNKIR